METGPRDDGKGDGRGRRATVTEMFREGSGPDVRRVLAEELDEIAAAREAVATGRIRSRKRGRTTDPIDFCNDDDRNSAAAAQLCGLAFSGGGIRSATFNLGVIQALADLGLLARADYLSTVSGGGYIGAWLSAWVYHEKGIAQVEKKLGKSARPTAQVVAGDAPSAPTAPVSAPSPAAESKALEREQPPITFLRENSNYLTPRLGFFGADTWSVISIYLRNLVLNLAILAGVLLAAVLVPRLLLAMFIKLPQVDAKLPIPLVGSIDVSLSDVIALLPLLVAVWASGFNLRFVRKYDGARTPPADAPTSRFKAARQALGYMATRQSGVLMLIVGPTTLGALFVAASMRDASPVTFWDFVILMATYLVLWVLLVVVWGPYKASTSSAGVHTGRGAGWVAHVLAFGSSGLSAVLAAVLVGQCTGSGMTKSAPIWMTIGVPVVLTIFSTSVVLHLGLMGRLVSEEVREWWSRLGGWLLIVSVTWAAFCGIALLGPLLLHAAGSRLNVSAAVAWLATTVFGVWTGRSPETNGKQGSTVTAVIAGVAPHVFVLGLVLALSAAADCGLLWAHGDKLVDGGWADYPGRLAAVPWEFVLGASVVCLVAALLLSRRVDVNDFSLQPLYRNRLVRCYLGASNPNRTPHPFTGFDPADDIALAGLARDDQPLRPYPLFNVALNLVKGEKLAWQERKAESFTLAPLHCGFGTYYRATGKYAQGRLTLGQAFATSGAAASPNMGYHSNPALAFLMTVFNVRLGMWLPNPKLAKWQNPGPRLGVFALFNELFGNTSEDASYVYLSDGGHFDNLGIYELVRRRCRFIIACDASADPKVHFDDLGSVIRKCRTDFGVDVELDTVSLQPDPQTRRCAYHCAVGKVQYPEGTVGTLLYLKASLTGREPVDVLNYAAGDALFPHQSTVDQWFNESQFESYRRLGYHCGLTVFEAAAGDTRNGQTLEGIFTSLRERWYPSTGIAAGTFTRHTATLDMLNDRIRANPRLSFLDAQIYASWPELMAGTTNPPRPNLWLPEDPEARREGFYVCAALIQLMENVYTDLDLATQLDHPDNRGWMNLFRHWSWCGMLRVTWSVTAATYGARFQTFCRERLDLDIGSVQVHEGTLQRLNPVEQDFVKTLRTSHPDSTGWQFHAVRLHVPNPVSVSATPETIEFTVGFAIVEHQRLVYLRIQDHLRKMGLARDALQYMIAHDLIGQGLGLTREDEESDDGATLKRLFDSALAQAKPSAAQRAPL